MCRYNDFKKYADEDAAAEYMYGMECLFRFYSYGLENNFRVPLYKVRAHTDLAFLSIYFNAVFQALLLSDFVLHVCCLRRNRCK
jgi:hypothetical protein